MKCSIVIRAYNEEEHLGRLFEGIQSQSLREGEVILVDSGSRDGTRQIAENNGATIVQIAPEQFSFGRSLNMGIAAARGECVVIASAHVRPVYPDWLECLLRPFEDPRIALVFGKQRGMTSSRFSEHQIFRQWFPDEDVDAQTTPFCNNANAAIRRSLWEQQPYNEDLTGLEDIAWAKWAQSQGHRIAYAAHAEIIHVHEEPPRRVYERYRREAMAFKRIFPESHFSVYDFARLTLSNIARDAQEASRQRLSWRQYGSILWFRTMQFWGTYQGYRNSSALTPALRQTFYYPPSPGVLPAPREIEPISYKEAKP
jgi:glycosyltransferase involved in cell wall biosynthesis